jgi:hypothetical protein
MEKSCTSPYHSSSNGIAERFNRKLLNLVGCLPLDKKAAWNDNIQTVVHAYNCTRHDTTGAIPYLLMYARDPILPIDIEYALYKPDIKCTNYGDYVKKLQEQLSYAFDLATNIAGQPFAPVSCDSTY